MQTPEKKVRVALTGSDSLRLRIASVLMLAGDMVLPSDGRSKTVTTSKSSPTAEESLYFNQERLQRAEEKRLRKAQKRLRDTR